MIERSVGGHDHDNRPVPVCRWGRSMLRSYLDLDRNTNDSEITAEIGLHENADRPAAELRRKFATRCPDPAFPPERHGPPSGAHRPFGNRAISGGANGAQDVSFGDRPRADVVQKAVIRLAH